MGSQVPSAQVESTVALQVPALRTEPTVYIEIATPWVGVRFALPEACACEAQRMCVTSIQGTNHW